VDSVDTSRNTTNTDAESDVDANPVNLLNVQNVATGDTSGNLSMAALNVVSVNHVDQPNVQRNATGDTRRHINTLA